MKIIHPRDLIIGQKYVVSSPRCPAPPCEPQSDVLHHQGKVFSIFAPSTLHTQGQHQDTGTEGLDPFRELPRRLLEGQA